MCEWSNQPQQSRWRNQAAPVTVLCSFQNQISPNSPEQNQTHNKKKQEKARSQILSFRENKTKLKKKKHAYHYEWVQK